MTSVNTSTTRRSFVARSGAAIATLFGYAAYRPRDAAAAGPCKVIHSYAICPTGTTSTCRVRFGPPSCVASEVTVYSPNEQYYLSCTCSCPSDPCSCEPEFFQARAAARNGGSCSCTCAYSV
jgi:hypothetical protein